MSFPIQEMSIEDYEEVHALWRASEGIKLTDTDSRESVARFLKHNPGLSFVVRDAGELVGAVLCGQDGRQGYLSNLVVSKSHRRKGLGRSLVGRCLFALMRIGIHNCNLFILDDSPGAMAFWEDVGLTQRVDLVMMSPRSSSES